MSYGGKLSLKDSLLILNKDIFFLKKQHIYTIDLFAFYFYLRRVPNQEWIVNQSAIFKSRSESRRTNRSSIVGSPDQQLGLREHLDRSGSSVAPQRPAMTAPSATVDSSDMFHRAKQRTFRGFSGGNHFRSFQHFELFKLARLAVWLTRRLSVTQVASVSGWHAPL